MWKFLISILLITTAVVFTPSCSLSTSENSCDKPLNPNGDSELAILMREMFKHLETEKIRIESSNEPVIYPDKFEKIRTAKPSSAETRSENFDEFALLYLSALRQYHQNDSVSKRISTFNNLVSSCIDCHKNECPGPVKKIEKNYIR